MRLMTWPANGGVTRQSPSDWTAEAKPEGLFWLDLELAGDPVGEILAKFFGSAVASTREPWEPHPRAKIIEEGDHLYLLLHEVKRDPRDGVGIVNTHFYLGQDFLVTVHEETPAGLACIWDQESGSTGPKGADHLFFLLADAMVDQSFPVLDAIADTVEDTEELIFPYPTIDIREKIFDLRKNLINLRRTIAPMREVFATLTRRENPLFDREALRLLGEVHDHLVRLYELIDTQRDLVGSLMDVYLTGLSNRLNEIMKTLTIIATIMMPLTVVVGIYGMNFSNMPGLHWRFGFWVIMGIMGLIGVGMLIFFKRRRWF